MILLQGFCPMGCGQTLYAEDMKVENRVICLGSDCPRPLAAQEILSDGETGHVVRFGSDGFTVRHPLKERLSKELFDCMLHRACADLDQPPNNRPGTYRARLEEGILVVSRIEEETS